MIILNTCQLRLSSPFQLKLPDFCVCIVLVLLLTSCLSFFFSVYFTEHLVVAPLSSVFFQSKYDFQSNPIHWHVLVQCILPKEGLILSVFSYDLHEVEGFQCRSCAHFCSSSLLHLDFSHHIGHHLFNGSTSRACTILAQTGDRRNAELGKHHESCMLRFTSCVSTWEVSTNIYRLISPSVMVYL